MLKDRTQLLLKKNSTQAYVLESWNYQKVKKEEKL